MPAGSRCREPPAALSVPDTPSLGGYSPSHRSRRWRVLAPPSPPSIRSSRGDPAAEHGVGGCRRCLPPGLARSRFPPRISPGARRSVPATRKVGIAVFVLEIDVLMQGRSPGQGTGRARGPLPSPMLPTCSMKSPGPYRPPGEANLSLVPRPSVGTLQKGAAALQMSRDQPRLWPPACRLPRRLTGIAGLLGPLSSRAVTGAFGACMFSDMRVRWGVGGGYSPGVLGSQALPERKTRGTVRRQQDAPQPGSALGAVTTPGRGGCGRGGRSGRGPAHRGAAEFSGPGGPRSYSQRAFGAPVGPPSTATKSRSSHPPRPSEPVWGWGTWRTAPSTHSEPLEGGGLGPHGSGSR